jgi:nicotinamidase-related amidase
MSERTALLLVDLLAGAFGSKPLTTCDGTPVLPNARRLLERARAAGALVVHVVEAFDETKYPPGSPVWNAYQAHPDVAPREGEIVVKQRRYDAFYESGLHERLTSEGVETVVVAGLSSPWCVDTAVRRAFGLGYHVVLAADAHGCSDGKTLSGPLIARHHNEILAACFALVKPVDEIEF